MLVNGVWQQDWNPYQKNDRQGAFIRQTSGFRHWITPDGRAGPTGEGGFKAEPGRYHLYVAYICPWASRTLMVRTLKRLHSVIGVSVVAPELTDQGWRFATAEEATSGADRDTINGVNHVHQLYTLADPTVSGRATVPVLWDKQRATIVNNESADIIQMLNSAFDQWGNSELDLRPASLLAQMEQDNRWLYDTFNNGVYQAGFAKTQSAYESAVKQVFATLEALEARCRDGRHYLLGDQLTETDIRAFVTLIRFDAAYHGLFKCNLRRVADYPHLQAYLERIYALDGIADTVRLDHIKRGYYSIKALNPNGIVPIGPTLPFLSS